MNWVAIEDRLPEWDCYLLVNDGSTRVGLAFFCKLEELFESFHDASEWVDVFEPGTNVAAYFGIDEIKNWRHIPNAPIDG